MMEEAINVQKREDNFDKKTLPSSIPSYFMSSFTMRTHETKKLEKIQKYFLWGGIGDIKKLHFVD